MIIRSLFAVAQLEMANIFKFYNVREATKYSLTLMHKAPDAELGPQGKVRVSAWGGSGGRQWPRRASHLVSLTFFFLALLTLPPQLEMDPMEIYTVKLKLASTAS
jgi:hypothetical protein